MLLTTEKRSGVLILPHMPAFPRLCALSLSLLLTAVTCSNATPRQQPFTLARAPYPVHRAGGPFDDSDNVCDQLSTTIPHLLAHRRREPLQLTDAISHVVAEGENPSTEELFAGIPSDVLVPEENIPGAISSAGEWDRSSVMADLGYGEQNEVQTVAGGLPAFCRFGANIVTSGTSGVWFEVWLPMSSNASSAGAIPVPVSTAPSSSLGDPQERPPNASSASCDGWRGRLVFVGNAGQKGSVNYAEMKQVLTRYREATASTNGGHFGSGSLTNWTIGNPESQTDFGHRAVHVAAEASQAVVGRFYGIKDRKTSKGNRRVGFPTYFKGCSTGGRQGLAEAQRYPDDFDGILAGSPAVFYNELSAYQIHVNSLQANRTSPRYIPQRLYSVIHRHVISECDAGDGVEDGVIQDPSKCKPDLDQLLCNATSSDEGAAIPLEQLAASAMEAFPAVSKRKASTGENCLTQDQLANLQDIYKALRYPDGHIIHEPVLYGSETVWTVTDGVVGKPFPPAPGWFQYQVLNETGPTTDFDPFIRVEGNYSLIQLGHDADPGGTNTASGDLGAFFARGSKLIHYHGLADQLIPSGASDRYHRLVHAHTSTKKALSHYYRYFHIPGMGHCRGGDGAVNFGGAGQSDAAGSRPLAYDAQYDALLALFEWVEYAKAPKHLLGAAYKSTIDEEPSHVGAASDQRPFSNGVKFSHKMCPYPKQAVLTNADAPYDADSLACRLS